jgi:hypothetical protein
LVFSTGPQLTYGKYEIVLGPFLLSTAFTTQSQQLKGSHSPENTEAEALWTYLPFIASKYSTCVITWKKAQTSGRYRAVCEADGNLTVLNLNFDDPPENALLVGDLKLN